MRGFFAEHGHRVEAFEVNPKACEYFATYCREFIEAGRITLYRGSYREFLDRKLANDSRADIVISNFATAQPGR